MAPLAPGSIALGRAVGRAGVGGRGDGCRLAGGRAVTQAQTDPRRGRPLWKTASPSRRGTLGCTPSPRLLSQCLQSRRPFPPEEAGARNGEPARGGDGGREGGRRPQEARPPLAQLLTQ